jgi:hypothetical protein
MAGRRIYAQFLFAVGLQLRPTNNAGQKNKQSTFNYKFSNGYGPTIFKFRHIAKPPAVSGYLGDRFDKLTQYLFT